MSEESLFLNDTVMKFLTDEKLLIVGAAGMIGAVV